MNTSETNEPSKQQSQLKLKPVATEGQGLQPYAPLSADEAPLLTEPRERQSGSFAHTTHSKPENDQPTGSSVALPLPQSALQVATKDVESSPFSKCYLPFPDQPETQNSKMCAPASRSLMRAASPPLGAAK